MGSTWSVWDEHCMRRALELAVRGQGHVEPNPMVGCVVAHPDRIVAEAFHERFGEEHAERLALRRAGPQAQNATLYVTLEPCCHHGKTPPCTEAIVQAGVRRVVAACRDPFPRVQGGGLRSLQRAGLQVEVGLCQAEAVEVLAPYLTRLLDRRPWVIVKYAMTWDGKIATSGGQSRWISSEESRQLVHQLRGRVDAIAVGSRTARQDDPLLIARGARSRTALRVVFDSQASLPLESQLVRTVNQAPVEVVACRSADPARVARLKAAGCRVWLGPEPYDQRLKAWLEDAAARGITNLLVEGGAGLVGTFLDCRTIDELYLFLAPKLLGGQRAPGPIAGRGIESIGEALPLEVVDSRWLGPDWHAVARILRDRHHWYNATAGAAHASADADAVAQ
ncbi:MAG: riboflavin biosynthesis protein RibD [Pirellulaceae bacterium]|nr:MAG: riboflavin biosynthesis protein RibD [Pirellulaceae bacterium]